MPTILQGLVDASISAAQNLGQDDALTESDIDDLIDSALALRDLIRRIDKRYEDRLARRIAPLDQGAVEMLHRAYESWYGLAERILTHLDAIELSGTIIDRAGEFRDACRSSHVDALEPKRLHEAAAQFEKGRGRPLREVVDEIRDRAV